MRTTLAAGLLATCLWAPFYVLQTGLRFNASASMPVGIWRVSPVARPLQHRDVVTFCLPAGPATSLAIERGYIGPGSCQTGQEPLIKPIIATAGDHVVVSPFGVSVNGAPVPSSAQLDRDKAGRSMPPVEAGERQVAEGEVWVLSTHVPNSWDSRYFGAIPVSSIIAAAQPVYVW